MTDVTSSPAAVITEPQARARLTAAERQARWRKNNSLRRVELYLRPETVERLDKLVRETGAFGRAEVVETLVAGATMPPLDNRRPRGAPGVHAGHRHLKQIPSGHIYMWTPQLAARPDMEHYEPPPGGMDSGARRGDKGRSRR
jgi:hypothetical protein